jgi:hypothetical protein
MPEVLARLHGHGKRARCSAAPRGRHAGRRADDPDRRGARWIGPVCRRHRTGLIAVAISPGTSNFRRLFRMVNSFVRTCGGLARLSGFPSMGLGCPAHFPNDLPAEMSVSMLI